jgi:hypothetical protein
VPTFLCLCDLSYVGVKLDFSRNEDYFYLTNCMVTTLFENPVVTQLVTPLKEHKDSLPGSQEHNASASTKPDEFSPHSHKTHFNVFLLSLPMALSLSLPF